MRSAFSCIVLLLLVTRATADVPCDAPISRKDVRQISRVIRGVTSKPILFILGVDEDNRLPGTVDNGSYVLDLKTGKRTPRYTRTDRVQVCMTYTDKSHIDVFDVRKVRGRWSVQSKIDWWLP